MSSLSIYSHLLKERSLLEVAVDDVQLLSSDSRVQGIGTKGLNCCTYVVVTGKVVVMAHISPLPGSSQQRARGTADAQDRLMRTHHDSYHSGGRAADFPTSGTSWGIFRDGGGNRPPVKAIVTQIQTSVSRGWAFQ